MAKIIKAECKTCKSHLIIDIEQKSAFCPYCGTRLIKSHRNVGLNTSFFKNLFSAKHSGFHEAGLLTPNNENAFITETNCYKCKSHIQIDESEKQSYCKNCGTKIRENGEMVLSSSKFEKNSPFLMFLKKYKVWFIVALCAIAVLFAIIVPKKPDSSVSPQHHSVSDTAESFTEKPSEKPTEAVTDKLTKPPTESITEEPTEKPTERPTEKPTKKPTERPTGKPTEAPTKKPTTAPTQPPQINTSAPVEDNDTNDYAEYSYVLNNNSFKFHYPDCRSVKKISPNNIEYYVGTRENLLSRGYSPCGICKP